MRRTAAAATVFAATAALLGACAEGSGGGAATPVAAAAAPAAPGPSGTRFDGRYSGHADIIFSRGRSCGTMRLEKTMVVQNGQARYPVDYGVVAVGPVQPDGSVRLSAETRRAVTVTGKIEGGRFTGEFQGGECSRSIELTKR